MSEMRGLTLWQPWASLLAIGAKEYETRGWATSYRGPIAIHAAKKLTSSVVDDIPDENWDAMYKALFPFYGVTGIHEDGLKKLPLGAVVAVGELVGCYPMTGRTSIGGKVAYAQFRKDGHVVEVTGNDLLFGDWTPGRFAWEFANVRMLKEPVPMRGAQGLWRVRPEDELLLKDAG
jgi:hypothetical protein